MDPEFERVATAGDAAALKARLEAGSDVNAKDRYGQSALMLAALAGELEP